MKFVVDRSKWRCGSNAGDRHGKGDTRLLNSEGYQCCLGFVCEQLGVPRGELLNIPTPEFLDHYTIVKQVLIDTWIDEISIITNDGFGSREERERLLSEQFANGGHELEFVGEYEDADLSPVS